MTLLRHKYAFLPLTEQELRALPTHRLLAYQARVRRIHESSWDDIDQEEVRARQRAAGMIRYKDDPAYEPHRDLIRTILAEREHVERRQR